MIRNQNGFTYVEFIIVCVALMLLVVPLFVALDDNRDKAREDEVKANVHIIQTAIERYFSDNRFYPEILLGGDRIGWKHWHEVNREDGFDPELPSNNHVHDPLIGYGYLESYPKNPFVTNGMRIIQSTRARGSGPNGQLQHGDGDPRFGFYGNTMGNGLDDPAVFMHRTAGIPPIVTSLTETRRTLDEETINKLGFSEPPEGLHYMMGGRKAFDSDGNVITVATWWPGNFFYRSFSEPGMGWHWWDPGAIPRGYKPVAYILGGYGALRTEGMDVIRLEERNWDTSDYIYYRLPPPWVRHARSSGIRCGYTLVEGSNYDSESINGYGLPAVFGGGDAFTGPEYYLRLFRHDSETFYGAPDGHPDGVITLLHSKIERYW